MESLIYNIINQTFNIFLQFLVFSDPSFSHMNLIIVYKSCLLYRYVIYYPLYVASDISDKSFVGVYQFSFEVASSKFLSKGDVLVTLSWLKNIW